jgi:ribosomal protein S18 acetylase RimI-like enzyme
MHTITLGPARIGDAPGIAQLSRQVIESGLPWNWTPRRVAAQMKDRETLVVVAKSMRELAGFAIAQFGTETVHLSLLGVAAVHQRHGVGRRLVAWVEESAVVAGLFTVKLEVRAGNFSARRFYAALGYKESESVRGYYSGVEDAVKLSRDLRTGLRD